jgi:hypothetical protein
LNAPMTTGQTTTANTPDAHFRGCAHENLPVVQDRPDLLFLSALEPVRLGRWEPVDQPGGLYGSELVELVARSA